MNLSDIVSQADHPESQLDALLRRMVEDLREASVQISAAVRDERRLADESAYEGRLAEEMDEKAHVAARRADDDLAREAIRRKLNHLRRKERLDGELELQREGVQVLREHLSALEAKVEETRRCRDLAVARRRLATHQQNVARRVGAGGCDGLERLEESVMDLQASTAAAHDELASRLSVIEQRARHGVEDQHVERELEAIKQRSGGLGVGS